MDLAKRIVEAVRVVQDFPIPGIPFPDVTSILEEDPALYRDVIDAFVAAFRDDAPDVVVCIESFGYVFGTPLAYLLESRLVLARRSGKLPRATHREVYDMIYDTGRSLEIHEEAIRARDRVLIVDDILASGGSLLATLRMVERSGGRCIGIACLMEASVLAQSPQRMEIDERGIPVLALASI